MGKINEIQQESTQSYGSNSFTTKIEDDTVRFDSAKDSFTFTDDTAFEGDVSIQGSVDLDKIDANEMEIDTLNASEVNTNKISLSGDEFVSREIIEDWFIIPTSSTSFTSFDLPSAPVVGKTYRILMNDIEYTSTAERYSGTNIGVIIPLPNEQGSITYDPENASSRQGYNSFWNGNSANTYSIYIAKETITKIPSKYIDSAFYVNNKNVLYSFGKNSGTDFGSSTQQSFIVDLNGTNTINIPTSLIINASGGSNSISGGYTSIFESTGSGNTMTNSSSVEFISTAGGDSITNSNCAIFNSVGGGSTVNNAQYSIALASAGNNSLSNTTDAVYISAGGGNSLSSVANTIFIASGSGNTSTTSTSATNTVSIFGGNSNTNNGSESCMIASSSSNSIGNGCNQSVVIGGSGGVSISNPNLSKYGPTYDNIVLNGVYGSSITGSYNTILSAYAEITSAYDIVIGGNSKTTVSGKYDITLSSYGANTLAGDYGVVISTSGANNISSGSAYNTIFATSGGNTVAGAYNSIIGGLGGISIPSTVSNAIALGCNGGITIDESNMVYVLDLKIKVGDNYYKLSDIVTALVNNGTLS